MNQIQYMHFREVNNDGTINSRGGATVAYRLNEHGNVDKYAISYCSRNDNYSRRRGRELTSGRLHYPALSQPASANAKDFRDMMELSMKTRGLLRPYPKLRRASDKPRAN